MYNYSSEVTLLYIHLLNGIWGLQIFLGLFCLCDVICVTFFYVLFANYFLLMILNDIFLPLIHLLSVWGRKRSEWRLFVKFREIVNSRCFHLLMNILWELFVWPDLCVKFIATFSALLNWFSFFPCFRFRMGIWSSWTYESYSWKFSITVIFIWFKCYLNVQTVLNSLSVCMFLHEQHTAFNLDHEFMIWQVKLCTWMRVGMPEIRQTVARVLASKYLKKENSSHF